ncbi:DUF72 domain-containing protein [Amycolatopsis taiwanensis]|nr:DUF72 domain-containing protein [Amycolatopsis taiwanensis]
MGAIQVGTASWTDRTLIASGWYPPEVDTPEKRLRFYADHFPLVEVDSTYYGMPNERTAALWAGRTPAGFTFNVKAFSLFTQHPTRLASLPAELRPDREQLGKDTVYQRDVPQTVTDELWRRFLDALGPLCRTGKLGAILLQFPPWFTISRANKNYILACAERLGAAHQPCVEFRHRSWLIEDNRAETLNFLSTHGVPLVCVDMPQGHASSVPPVVAATAKLAVVRFHGHSEKWTSKDIHERFGYRYSLEELREWAPRVKALSEQAERVQVLLNNCYRDYAQVNAQQLMDLLQG